MLAWQRESKGLKLRRILRRPPALRHMKILSMVALVFALLHNPVRAADESLIAQQKKTVVFIYGTVHPTNADRTPKLDANGKPVVLEMPLGTGFLVSYPDVRGGPEFSFFYLVTAKHVLRDSDGKLLRSVRVRANLKSSEGDSQIEFANDIPVSDANGNLLWYHGTNEADEAVAIDFLLNKELFDFKVIPTSIFVDEATLESSDVEEGDTIYFIGLLAQFSGSKKNYPVVRRGTLAMMTDEDVPTPAGPQKVFIAELQSWPGNSGSPVFLSLGGLRHGGMMLGENFRFLGILLGDFVNKIQATIVGGPQITLGGEDAANVGISLIVPATRLKEILDATESQNHRDAEIQKLPKGPK